MDAWNQTMEHLQVQHLISDQTCWHLLEQRWPYFGCDWHLLKGLPLHRICSLLCRRWVEWQVTQRFVVAWMHSGL